MAQDFQFNHSDRPAASLRWYEVWLRALTRPSEENYQQLLADPQARPTRAYLWVFVISLVGFIINAILQSVFFESPWMETFDGYGMLSLITLACAVPLGAALAVLGLIVQAALVQFIARLLGGTGTFDNLVYLFGAITAPVGVITSLIGSIPLVNCLTFLLAIYAFVLQVIAVKATNRFGYGQAFLANIVVPVVAFLLFACCALVLFTILAPASSDIFQNIIP